MWQLFPKGITDLPLLLYIPRIGIKVKKWVIITIRIMDHQILKFPIRNDTFLLCWMKETERKPLEYERKCCREKNPCHFSFTSVCIWIPFNFFPLIRCCHLYCVTAVRVILALSESLYCSLWNVPTKKASSYRMMAKKRVRRIKMRMNVLHWLEIDLRWGR